MKASVVVFPGSNCDHDAYTVLSDLGLDTQYVWHKESSLPDGTGLVVLPGGFSYGDYLRCGSIAKFSNIMRDVVSFANKGGHVMGICNGFQILTESGLLPGTLVANSNLKFVCMDTYLSPEGDSSYTKELDHQSVYRIPVAHGEGNYCIDSDGLKRLEDNNQVAFRYSGPNGEKDERYNFNGSMNSIAGITNENKNVLGMMPHPERYSDSILGCDDGLAIFKSLLNNIN